MNSWKKDGVVSLQNNSWDGWRQGGLTG